MEFEITAEFDNPLIAYKYLSDCLLNIELQLLEVNHNKHLHEISIQKANTETLSTNKLTAMRAAHTIEFARNTIAVYDKQLANLQTMKDVVEHRLARYIEYGITDETLRDRLLEHVNENDSKTLGIITDSKVSLHRS